MNEFVRLERAPTEGTHGAAFMAFNDVRNYVDGLKTPLAVDLMLCLWNFWEGLNHGSGNPSGLVLSHDMEALFDTVDPSGNAFREMQTRVVTHLVPKSDTPAEFRDGEDDALVEAFKLGRRYYMDGFPLKRIEKDEAFKEIYSRYVPSFMSKLIAAYEEGWMRRYAHDMGRKAASEGKRRELSASSLYPTNWVEGYDEYKRFG